ncbi:DUF6415 family natural product biosynthesis protein [Streptomyces sp. NPDC050585]|uniref:DUF6415 family natural product biosynthesis protein n=1 Tax=Streptomyces sp. NPDC050585 TaxID=3365632 RepID=UPI0037A75D68
MATATYDIVQQVGHVPAPDEDTLHRTLAGLRRAWAADVIRQEPVYEDLERLLSPYEPLCTLEQLQEVTARLRETATALVEAVPWLVSQYPTEQMQTMVKVSAEHPPPDYAYGHARRFAAAIEDLLNTVGDAP